jgi:predicted DNA binding protein
MKYVRLTLHFDDDAIHPVHRHVSERADLHRETLLHGNTATEGRDTFLFHVEGDPETYATVLEATDQVRDYELRPVEDDAFYAYIMQTADAFGELLFEAFSRTGVITVPPIRFEGDRTAALTVVGDADAIGETVSSLPEGVEADVERIGRYEGDAPGFDPGLTDRQFEAVAAAVELGYYDVPSECSVEAVGDRLECSASTAAEHLRKAEGRIVRALVRWRSRAD